MGKSSLSGADHLINALETLGVRHVFCVPGSGDRPVYNALRQSSIQTILATNELNAAFMANGYFRNSGKVGVIIVIPGPGFTTSITGIVEAFFDSAGLVCIICKYSKFPGKKFQFQDISEKEINRTFVKKSLSVSGASEIRNVLFEAFALASTGEPGPVLVELSFGVLSEKAPQSFTKSAEPKFNNPLPDKKKMKEAVRLISSSCRAVLFVGQGALNASYQVQQLVELLKAPVLTTTSGRGILPEDHPMSLPCGYLEERLELINSILYSSDLIVALGCKFSSNSTSGFRLNFSKEKLIHVDASPGTLGANYPARLEIAADVVKFLDLILDHKEEFNDRIVKWENSEVERLRNLFRLKKRDFPEPRLEGIKPPTALAFFTALRKILPEKSCLVTDAGLHQLLARKYFEVRMPRGLIVPSDYQSVGFGLPAGIGAKLSDPERMTVVLTGDGGFAMTGMELITLAREKIKLLVIIFNDNHLGIIRLNQLAQFGKTHAVRTGEIDYSKLCEAFKLKYYRLNNNLKEILEQFQADDGTALLEVKLKDSFNIHKSRIKGLIKNKAGNLLPDKFLKK